MGLYINSQKKKRIKSNTLVSVFSAKIKKFFGFQKCLFSFLSIINLRKFK